MVNSRAKQFLQPLLLLVGIHWCGCAGETTYNDRGSKIEQDNGEVRIKRNESLNSNEEQRQVTISMQDEESGALALTSESPVDGLQGFIECDGGIKELVMNQRITLLGSPTSCVFKLAAITRNGFIYAPKSTSPFTNFAIGDTGVFISPNGGEMRFTVVQQLPSPLKSNAVVSLKFLEVASGSSVSTDSEVKMYTGSVAESGEVAPHLVMKSFSINPISSLQTNAVARFECMVPMRGSSDATYTCNGDLISNLRHWTGPAPELLSIPMSFFDSAFASAKPLNSQVPAVAYFPPGTSGLVNGGIEITYPIGSSNLIKSMRDFTESGMVFAFAQPKLGSYVYSIGHLAEVHIVGVSKSATDSAGQVPIVVKTQKPTVLALTSSESINWNITLASGTKISRVILYSKGKSTVTGISSDTVVENYCSEGCQNDLRTDMFKESWLVAHPTLESAQFMIFIQSLLNLEVTSLQAANSAPAEGFTIPKP